MTQQEIIASLWKKACEFDKIPVDSKFVVFSDGNRAARLYNAAVCQFMAR
jgi:hypothetical protein